MSKVDTYVAGISPDGETIKIMHASHVVDVTSTLTERLYLEMPDAHVLTGRMAKALWDASRPTAEVTVL